MNRAAAILMMDDGSAASQLVVPVKGPYWRETAASLSARLAAFGAAGSDRDQIQMDAGIAFAVRCASAALLYASQIAMARWMGSAEYGIYITLWTGVLLIGGLSHLGMNLGIIRLVAVAREAGDLPRLRGLITGARILALVMGTLAASACAFAVHLFGVPAGVGGAGTALIILLCIPLFTLTDVQDGIGRGNGWIAIGLIPPYVIRPALVLGFMTLAWASGASMAARTAAIAAVAATATAALLQALAVSRMAYTAIGPGPRTYEPASWLSASLPLLAMSGCEIVLQNTDVLMLSQMTDPAQVAVYYAAGKTMSLIMFIHYAVGSAVANRFVSLKARGDEATLRAAVRDSVRWTFWPSLAAAIPILALGRPLLSLFGRGFEDGFPVMAILVVGYLARSAMGPAEFLLNMLGEQRRCAAVMLSAAALDIALNLILIPRYGITGAAASTALALVAAALLNASVARRRLGLDVAIWKNL